MRRWILLMGVGVAAAAAPKPERFSLKDRKEYPMSAVQGLVDRLGEPGQHHGCVVGVRNGRDEHAWVYWKQADLLFLWKPSARRHALLGTGHFSPLTHLKPGEAETLLPSEPEPLVTHEFTEAWQRELLSDCEKVGDRFELQRASLPPLPPRLEKARQSFQAKGDYASLKILSRALKKGMTRTEVRRLLGEQTYSPTEGQDYYPSRDREERIPGAPGPSPVGLVIEYRHYGGPDLAEYTGLLESFEMTPIGE